MNLSPYFRLVALHRRTRLRTLLATTLLGFGALAAAALPTPDADDGAIILPPGFRALVFADNLAVVKKVGNTRENLRFLAVAPNGDVYAKGKFGLIWALRDTDGDGRADLIKEFGPGDGGTHILFHDGYLYHSSRTAVYRYKYIPGELVPSSPLEVVIRDLPAEVDHDAKAFAFDEAGGLLVEIGSPYNVFSKPDRQLGANGFSDAEVATFQKTYGGFWRFDANKLNQTQADGVRFSTGHRHCLSLAWQPISKNFFMAMMGRDNLNIVDPDHYDALDNAERVAEEFHLLKQGANLGWPYSYWDPIKNTRMRAPEYGGDNHAHDNDPRFDPPTIAFPAHWAPFQLCWYNGDQFPQRYRGGMFLAFHGSWNRSPRSQAGYKVVFIPFDSHGLPTGSFEDFAMGFAGRDYFTSTSDARFRPAGVAVGPDGSLYVSETQKGRIWRIIYTGETRDRQRNDAASAPPVATQLPIDADSFGGRIYHQVCAACHMTNGSGVPSMQPALVGNKVVAGDDNRLIRVVLFGPAAVLPPDREKFANIMPAFGAVYSDVEIASVINTLRKNFAPGSSEVTPAEVARLRAAGLGASPSVNQP